MKLLAKSSDYGGHIIHSHGDDLGMAKVNARRSATPSTAIRVDQLKVKDGKSHGNVLFFCKETRFDYQRLRLMKKNPAPLGHLLGLLAGQETDGCPLYSHPANLKDNKNCVLCFTCLRACPHRNVQPGRTCGPHQGAKKYKGP